MSEMYAPRWPLAPEPQILLDELARLIARGGAARFLRAPVIAADEAAYPDPWDQGRDALGRLLARTVWYAGIDLEVELDDQRTPGAAADRDLRDTRLELIDVRDGRACFVVTSIGNDDVAGLCAHEVGRVVAARLAGDGQPFRGEPVAAELPGAIAGSIAAIYVGLGVIATNGARYNRSAGRRMGQLAIHEFAIAGAGGLDSRLAAFLLAVQATVRDDVLAALDTLRPTQAADVAAWRELLDNHETELRAWLALDDAPMTALTQAPQPPRFEIVARFTEDELAAVVATRSHRVYRVRAHNGWSMMVFGFLFGPPAGALIAYLVGASTEQLWTTVMAMILVGPILGWIGGRRWITQQCVGCRRTLTARDVTCRFCGGTVAGELADPLDRFDRDEELDRLEAGPE